VISIFWLWVAKGFTAVSCQGHGGSLGIFGGFHSLTCERLRLFMVGNDSPAFNGVRTVPEGYLRPTWNTGVNLQVEGMMPMELRRVTMWLVATSAVATFSGMVFACQCCDPCNRQSPALSGQ
jgi:hypothetical protein